MDSPIRLHLERTSRIADATQQPLSRDSRPRRKPAPPKESDEEDTDEAKHELDEQA